MSYLMKTFFYCLALTIILSSCSINPYRKSEKVYDKNLTVLKETISEKEAVPLKSIVVPEIIIDTLYIKWKNNFFYTLKMKSPQTELDNDPIFVQINTLSDSSYDFTAKIGFSEFKQKGTVYKIK